MDCRQVEELLPAYALNALGGEETDMVEAHLDACPWCTNLLREHLHVSSALAQVAEASQPPQALKTRTLKAIGGRAHQRPGRRTPVFTPARFVLASSAIVGVLLLAAVIAFGIRMTQQVDDLQRENSELAAQISQVAAEDEKLVDMVMEQRSLTYFMAAADKQVSWLKGEGAVPEAEGMLMIASRSGAGILMAKGLEPSSGEKAYQVWLTRDGQPVTVGRLLVDEAGWGILTLWPDQPITLFQQVSVTEEPVEGSSSPTGSPVLWATIAP